MKRMFLKMLGVVAVGFVFMMHSGIVWAVDPVEVGPDIYKVVFENEKVRVSEITFKPGAKIPMHDHAGDHFVYAMSPATMLFSYPDGKTMQAEIKTGQVVWSGPETHAAENVGETEFRALVTENKIQEPVLYERLGGEKAISMVVDDFVARTSVNPAVNFTRRGTPREWQATPENVATLKKHLIDFIGTATGGPQNYQGRDMKTAHEGMQITDAEFDALAADLQASLEALGVPEREKSELMTIAGTTRGAIVEKR